ncbi:MAG: hypothetical protein H0X47_09525 [Nitrospirales bacterium]|nr:hypothetical protein [Nitrospirales bacterium]
MVKVWHCPDEKQCWQVRPTEIKKTTSPVMIYRLFTPGIGLLATILSADPNTPTPTWWLRRIFPFGVMKKMRTTFHGKDNAWQVTGCQQRVGVTS